MLNGRLLFLRQLEYLRSNSYEIEEEWLFKDDVGACVKLAEALAVPDELRRAFTAYCLDYIMNPHTSTHLDGAFYNDEDVKSGIYDKLYCFYRPLMDQVEKETNTIIGLYIEPSYEDRSYIIAIAMSHNNEQISIPFVVYRDGFKVWNSFFNDLAPETIYKELEDICQIAKRDALRGLSMYGDAFVIALIEKGLLASTWIVRGTEESAVKIAEALAAELNLNIEDHDLAVERPLPIRAGGKLLCNSERIWTWAPDKN